MDMRPSADGDSIWEAPGTRSLDEAVFYTLAYADVFSYPLTLGEIHRYLIGATATPEAVADALVRHPEYAVGNGCYALPGRADLVERREQRSRVAATMWPRALAYGRAMARLPFVRMVALTGALSMANVSAHDDFDYLIVAASGRVWLTRLFIIQMVVKRAARCGDEVCPNYLVAEHALALQERTLYHAHEVVQMVPLSGLDVYRRLRAENRWADAFLPNAAGPPSFAVPLSSGGGAYQRWLEASMRTPLGTWLDRREMARMARKLSVLGESEELSVSPERCKGHVGAHGHMTLEAFMARVRNDPMSREQRSEQPSECQGAVRS